MQDMQEAWSEALPKIRDAVTGVGIWTALNACVPVAFEDGNFVLGLPAGDQELAGHLKVVSTRRLVEQTLAEAIGQNVTLRVIEGTSIDGWEAQKRKDAESRRLQEQSLNKMRLELNARSNWETVYEQLSRRYAAIVNKSLPQNRARFFNEAIELVAETRKSQESWDEPGERNFARCLERVAQYTDVPATIVAIHVLEASGEL